MAKDSIATGYSAMGSITGAKSSVSSQLVFADENKDACDAVHRDIAKPPHSRSATTRWLLNGVPPQSGETRTRRPASLSTDSNKAQSG